MRPGYFPEEEDDGLPDAPDLRGPVAPEPPASEVGSLMADVRKAKPLFSSDEQMLQRAQDRDQRSSDVGDVYDSISRAFGGHPAPRKAPTEADHVLKLMALRKTQKPAQDLRAGDPDPASEASANARGALKAVLPELADKMGDMSRYSEAQIIRLVPALAHARGPQPKPEDPLSGARGGLIEAQTDESVARADRIRHPVFKPDTRGSAATRRQAYKEEQNRVEGWEGKAVQPTDAQKMNDQIFAADRIGQITDRMQELYQKHGVSPWPTDAQVELQSLATELQPMITSSSGMGSFTEGHRHLTEELAKPGGFKVFANTNTLPIQLRAIADTAIHGVEARGRSLGLHRIGAGGAHAMNPPAPGGMDLETTKELPQVKTQQEWEALPSGAEYLDPNGKHKRKK